MHEDRGRPALVDQRRREVLRDKAGQWAQLFRDQVLAITEPEEGGLAPSSPTDPGRPPVMTNNDNWWPGK